MKSKEKTDEDENHFSPLKIMNEAIINPAMFKLPKLEKDIILFFILKHFYMFQELVAGSKIKSYGPAKRFSFEHKGKLHSVLGGMIGAPLAVINVENAIASGGRNFSSFGTAGWIGETQREIGSLVVPEKGMDETGIIRDYEGADDLTSFNPKPGLPTCNGIVTVQ